MGTVIDIQNGFHRQKLDGWWIISVNVTNCGNTVEYREKNGVMVHAKSFRDLPALVEQGRKLLARERAVRSGDRR